MQKESSGTRFTQTCWKQTSNVIFCHTGHLIAHIVNRAHLMLVIMVATGHCQHVMVRKLSQRCFDSTWFKAGCVKVGWRDFRTHACTSICVGHAYVCLYVCTYVCACCSVPIPIFIHNFNLLCVFLLLLSSFLVLVPAGESSTSRATSAKVSHTATQHLCRSLLLRSV